MKLKNMIIAALMTSIAVNYAAVTIPKSSLEAVKSQIESDLQSATKQKNSKLTKKYQAELDSIKDKIKIFERDWLSYKKHKLEAQLDQIKVTRSVSIDQAKIGAIQTEIAEITALLKNYA